MLRISITPFVMSSFLLGIILPLRANLGETLDQSIVRYGAPFPSRGKAHPDSKGDSGYFFFKNDLVVETILRGNVVRAESITKKGVLPFSDKEIEQILRTEG